MPTHNAAGRAEERHFQFVEAKTRLGAMYGFLVPGNRSGAESEIRRLLKEWNGELVELGGQRIATSTIEHSSIVIRHETAPRGTGPASGRPRYAIDGTFIDGCEASPSGT